MPWKAPSRAEAYACDREILALAWPAILSASIDPILSTVDTYWVSVTLGTVSLAALGPAINLEDWLFEILKTIQVPVRSLTARAMAAADPASVRDVLAQSLCLSWRIGLAVALGGSLLAPLLLQACSVAPSSPLFEPARAYLVPRLWGTPGLMTLIVLQAALAGGFKDSKAVLRSVLLGAAINAVLTPALLIAARLGVAGAAWATTAACYGSAAAAWLAVQRRGPPGARWLPRLRDLAARALLGRGAGEGLSEAGAAAWMPLLRANAAMSVRTLSSVSTWLVAGVLVTRLGVVEIAAHTCMAKAFLMLLFTLYGFQIAGQVLVSSEVGRGDARRGRWTAARTVRLGVATAACAAAALWFGQGVILRALHADAAVAAVFRELVPPATSMLLIYGVLWVLDGVLYGLGDYVWSARCTTLAAAAAIATMLLFVHRASGVWWSFNVMTAIRTVAVVHRVFLDPKSPLAGGGPSERPA